MNSEEIADELHKVAFTAPRAAAAPATQHMASRWPFSNDGLPMASG